MNASWTASSASKPRAEHAVAVGSQLGAVLLELLFDPGCDLHAHDSTDGLIEDKSSLPMRMRPPFVVVR